MDIKRTFKGYIFDLDGTLIKILPAHRYELVELIAKDLGVKASKNFADKFWFEHNRDNIIQAFLGVNPELFWDSYKKHDTVELRKKNAAPYEDVDFIRELKNKRFKTGIFTGAPEHILDFELDLIGRENFDVLVIARNVNGIREKPDPQGLLMCIEQLSIPKEEIVYIGNAAEDIETARAANVYDILLDREEYVFENLRPSLTIKSLYELRELI